MASMGFYGSLWVSMGHYRQVRVFVRKYVFYGQVS